MQLTSTTISCQIDTGFSLVRSQWLGEVFSGTYREGLLHVCQLIKEQHLSYCLYRTSQRYTPNFSDQTWMVEVLCPLLADTGLQKFAVVVSGDIFQHLVADLLCSKAAHGLAGKVQLQTFIDLESAEDWLAHERRQTQRHNSF